MNRLVFAFLAAFCAVSCVSSENKTYTNPVRTTTGEYVAVADPFVYKHDGVYYLTGTTAMDAGFDYYTSTDLATWEFRGPLFRKSESHYGVGAFWAPEVKYYNGKFYLTYCALDAKSEHLLTSLAVSDTPGGPYAELYTPWFDLGYSVIDSHIFVDDDPAHTPYLYFSRNGSVDGYGYGANYVVELLPDLSGLAGEPVLVSEASQPWELVAKNIVRCNEGVFVFKKDGTYYMTYSANDTGREHYGVGTATASHPLGPWVKDTANPILDGDREKGVSSPGHNSIVEAPDGKGMFIVYHTHRDYDAPKPSQDRVVNIDRLYFDKDGNLRVDGPTRTPQPL